MTDAARSHLLVGPASLKDVVRKAAKRKIRKTIVQQAAEAHMGLQEKLVRIPSSLGITRSAMPQIASDDVPDFLRWLKEKGVQVRKGRVRAKDLKGTQNSINKDKARSMSRKAELLRGKPSIASSDGYILDGHHRWAGALLRDENFQIPIHRVAVTIRRLLALAKEYPGAGSKKMSEAYRGGRGPKGGMKTLQKGRVKLTPEERALVMQRKATWNHGPKGEATPAVWKSEVNGQTWYVTNTHRAYNVTKTLKGTIARYHDFIKGTA